MKALIWQDPHDEDWLMIGQRDQKGRIWWCFRIAIDAFYHIVGSDKVSVATRKAHREDTGPVEIDIEIKLAGK